LEGQIEKRKKVLIITYDWPPAGGPGVQRVLKFVKYLPQFGWEPIVLTVANGEYPAIDHSLENDIPEGIKVYKTKTIEPFGIFKFLSGKKKKENIDTFILDKKSKSFSSSFFSFIRSNIFLPDARVGWLPLATKKAKKIIKDHNISIILTSSPPHSVQLIGLKLKSELGATWVADFRDPWIDAFWEKGEKRLNWVKNKLSYYEKEVFRNANLLITVTKSFKRNFEKKYPNSNIVYLPNGYDSSDFKSIEKKINDVFIIRYFGSIAASQIPHNLLSVLKSEKPSEVILELYGNFDQSILELANKIDVIQIMDYLPHNLITTKMQTADLLLLLIPSSRGDIIPGKLFEYIGSGTKILSVGPKGDAAEIIENYQLGYCFDFNEVIPNSLFSKELNNNNSPLNLVDSFERKKQTKELAGYFEKLII
jgi:glycosyltransferase involved in cell wall biosynthesis